MEVTGRIHTHTSLFTGEEKPCTVWIECWKGAWDGLNFLVKKDKPFACVRIRSPDRSARSLDTILTELPGLQIQTIENLRRNIG